MNSSKGVRIRSLLITAGLCLSLFQSINITTRAATFWQESFQNPELQGKGATGGSPPDINLEGVTKWSLDISRASLTARTDWFRVEEGVFEGRDLDGPAVWESELIPIDSLVQGRFVLEVSEEGDHESGDYVDIYYSLDGEPFQRVPNWNQLGTDQHTLVGDKPDDGDWGSTTITRAVNGETLKIRLVMSNNAGSERLQLRSVMVIDDTPVTPIPDIQYTADPGGDSPLAGLPVTTSGVVTAAFQDGFFLQDPAGGPWSGLWVYDPDHSLRRGNLILVSGTAAEFHHLTEINQVTRLHLISDTVPLPDPAELATVDTQSEAWEGVLVRVTMSSVVNAQAGYGEWIIDDGSGPTRIDDRGDYPYTPVTGDQLTSITGPIDFSHDHYKIQPRDAHDILPHARLVINEILADPAMNLEGDANQDGNRDGSEDEFVEIVNHSVWDVNLSGWTLQDSTGVRHIFPSGTTLSTHCALIIFGGGSPEETFGGALVQTASSGSLSLNNSGDALLLHDGSRARARGMYGAEGSHDQSLTRHPDITGLVFRKHSSIPAARERLFSPGTQLDGDLFSGCGGNSYTRIYNIQYPPDEHGASPLLSRDVTTEGVVSAAFYSGYFLNTANGGDWSGIWIHDPGNAPRIGDRVRVTGTVEEYYGLTELNQVTGFEIISTHNTLPEPQNLSTRDASHERWEGVLVQVVNAVVSNLNPSFGEWSVDDGSGEIAVGDKGTYTYDPVAGDLLESLTGPLDYSYGQFTIQPRGDGDIDLPAPLMINEFDADQDGMDRAEFLELYDSGDGYTDLAGTVLVLYNGADNQSYQSYDLDGWKTDSRGYFVICGDRNEVRECDYDISPNVNFIQNGADAIALFRGDGSDFPDDSPLNSENLLDAVVYGTGDKEDLELLQLLDPRQPQVDEDSGGMKDIHSNQRFPNGSGELLQTEAYGQDIPTPGHANIRGCGDPAVLIHTIQGEGMESPLAGQNGIVVEGIVSADFQDPASQLGGFFLQEEARDQDQNPATSEGIFIFDNGSGIDVQPGDLVRVVGRVTEYYGLTELSGVGNILVCGDNHTLSPTYVTLPVEYLANWEAYEGMLVSIPTPMTITSSYALGRDGELDLAVDNRLFAPTNSMPPGEEAMFLQEENRHRSILLDDGSQQMYPDSIPFLPEHSTLRLGDRISSLTGILSYGYGRYRLHPTQIPDVSGENDRPETPVGVGGSLTIASLNLGNYFTTIDTGVDICGPDGNHGCRGADSLAEFNRQREKLIAALTAPAPDIIGVMELENNGFGPGSAIHNLAEGLTASSPPGTTYTYIDPGVPHLGSDAITVGLLYRQETVAPVGRPALITTPPFQETNRAPLAVTFSEIQGGETFTVVVNHFKSKSGCPDLGPDADQGDGQGCWNQARSTASLALDDWLASDPTGSGDPDFLILGDLNAYREEDPIRILSERGYIDLTARFSSGEIYTYARYGQSGQLDYAFASPSLLTSITGAGIWHINADEPRVLDYNLFNQDGFYESSPFRSSDHDPLLIGIDFEGSGVPEIHITGNKIPILNGEMDPSYSVGSDFGFIALQNGAHTSEFVIQNTGQSPLIFANQPPIQIHGEHAGDFQVLTQPSPAVSAGGGIGRFSILFNPGGSGERQALVVLDSNDPDENPYLFAVSGTGLEGKQIGPAGGELNTNPWSVSIPPLAVMEKSVFHLDLDIDPLSLSRLNSFRTLNKLARLNVFSRDGTSPTSTQAPLQVCCQVEAADIREAGGDPGRLSIGITRNGNQWTLLDTSYHEQEQTVCASTLKPGTFAVMAPELPETGYPPTGITSLPRNTGNELLDTAAGITLFIPRLGISRPVINIPTRGSSWDLSWLGDQIGYLSGTAFPTRPGNTVLTGHVNLPSGLPGPFSALDSLRWGDQIIISAWGERYIYQVIEKRIVSPTDFSILGEEEYDVLTLVTCRNYDFEAGRYLSRLVVKAVLIAVDEE